MPLTRTNDQLRSEIGRVYGAGDVVGSFSTDQANDVERFLQYGKRRFYNPLDETGKMYEWKFLTLTLPFTLVASQSTFALPPNFSYLHGPVTFAVGSQVLRNPIEVTSAERVLARQQGSDTSGTPQMAAYRAVAHNEGDFLTGMRYELLLWPTPDSAYTLDLRYRCNPLAPSDDDVLPIGDECHVQTLIEACLTEIEKFNGEPNGPHEQAFQERIRASISHDRLVSCPETLGRNRDRSDSLDPWGSWRDLEVYTVTPPLSWGSI